LAKRVRAPGRWRQADAFSGAMIYVCKGCFCVCGLPFKICDWLCKTCGEAIGKCCTGCLDYMDRCLTGCARIFGRGCGAFCSCILAPLMRPLAGYFVLSMLFGLPLIYVGANIVLVEKDTCRASQNLGICCIAFGLAHVLFAPYIQIRLTRGMWNDEEEAHGAELVQRAWTIMLYDIGFCLYTPVFLASFGSSFWALFWIRMSFTCSGGAGLLLFFYGILALMYLAMWTCVVTCCGIPFQAFRGKARSPQMRAPMTASSHAASEDSVEMPPTSA